MSKSGEIKGLDKLVKDLINLSDEGREVVHEVTKVIAQEIAFDAKLRAPVNKQKNGGSLHQSIEHIKVTNFTYKVVANATGLAPYAAYVEFGTGGLVEVPAELKEMAIKFKGKGIKKIDLRPQPYLYPAFVKGRLEYYDKLKEELKALTKKI